jgi:hypothetical protein
MTKGVIYFNQGNKCCIRLLVSLFSLRKHYDGDITILLCGEQNLIFLALLLRLNTNIMYIDNNGEPPLVKKSYLWKYSPYDITIFLDADTLITDSIDEYFEKIREYKFCVGEFAGWTTNGGIISSRINRFKKIVPDYIEPSLRFGKAVNTGIFGFTKDAEILKEWEIVTRLAWKNNCSKIPDEVGCQVLLFKYKHWVAPTEWGASVRFHNDNKIKIIHYHGRKHCSNFELCSLWKIEFWNLFRSCKKELHKYLKSNNGDRRFNRYLKELKDLTIVIAVDDKYLPKLKDNYQDWFKTFGILEYPIVCFYNNIIPEQLEFLGTNTTLIKWDMNVETQREKMLSSFVLGINNNVKTKYFMKVDVDTKCIRLYDKYSYNIGFENDWFESDLVSHRWGYTKPGKWLVELEKWADTNKITGNNVFNPDEYDLIQSRRRYGHKRICSYICLHKTDFVIECSNLCGSRMPVPSHDTYLWYMAVRMNKKIKLVNFKRKGFKH